MKEVILQKITDAFRDSSVITYQKDQIITLAGESPKGVSLLLDGIIEQYAIAPEGNKVTVNIFKPPSFFPMSWAINKTPNAYFFAAVTDVRVKQISADQAVRFLQDNPDVLFDLLSRVYTGTDALLRRLVLATSGTAGSRLIFELLIEVYRFNKSGGSDEKLLVIKQHVLAARSGLARETVSRELHKLQKNNLVSLTEKGIIIHLKALEKELDLAM